VWVQGVRREEGVGARNEGGMDPILLVHIFVLVQNI
jgi:hypothetical protein